jgi:hypothetical protein
VLKDKALSRFMKMSKVFSKKKKKDVKNDVNILQAYIRVEYSRVFEEKCMEPNRK